MDSKTLQVDHLKAIEQESSSNINLEDSPVAKQDTLMFIYIFETDNFSIFSLSMNLLCEILMIDFPVV